MQVRILKGTNQIGGVITEITSKRAKIIIDFGNDLDDIIRLEQIEGLTTGKPTYNGIIITHNHQDHMGRIDEALPYIPVYMSDTARNLYERVFCMSETKGKIQRKTINIEDRKSFKIKDITITPYTVDHSAYNAFMILIEAEHQKILHTGDFRSHGYKGKLLKKTLEDIGKVDLLIIEGTTFSREQIRNKTEAELAGEIAERTKDYNQVLMLMATTNTDRAITMCTVAEKTNKTVIYDILLSNALEEVTEPIPTPLNSDNIYVFLPRILLHEKGYTQIQKIHNPLPR